MVEHALHDLDRVQRALPWAIAKCIRRQVRLQNRFTCAQVARSAIAQLRMHKFDGRLDHPVPYGWDAERTLAATGLGNHDPPHRLWFVPLPAQVLP